MSPITRLFNSQIFTILASVCSILGLVSSFYFYKQSILAPDLSYHVSPISTPIVKAGSATGLSASFAGQPIVGDISTAQVSIWNAGKLPIRKNDILTPILLKVGGNAKILDVITITERRPANQIKLDRSRFDSGSLGIEWQILEQNDGCVIQILYTGKVGEAIEINGDIVGQSKFSEVKFSGDIKSPEDQYKPKRGSLSILLFEILAKTLLIYYFLYYIKAQIERAEGKSHLLFLRIFKITFLGLNGLSVAITLTVYLNSNSSITPFN